MKTWIKTFVHESLNIVSNYEQLETFGDRVLELAFTDYILKRFPQLNSKQVTLIKSTFMSKDKQPDESKKLKFDKLILVQGTTVNKKMLEDVFEAFFGALFTVGNRVIPGYGYTICFNMIKSIYDKIEIRPDDVMPKFVSQLKEISDLLSKKEKIEPKPVCENSRGEWTMEVRLSETQINFFASRGIRIRNPVLSTYTNAKKEFAYAKATEYALQKLEQYGVTEEWIKQNKSDKVDPNIKSYLPEVYKRLKANGYDDYYFYRSKTGRPKGLTMIMFVGIKYNKDKSENHIILLNQTAKLDLQAKQLLVKRYASGEPTLN